MSEDIMSEDIKDISYEQAMDELQNIVEKLEQGNAPLEEAIALYERGAKLRAYCEKRLKEAKMRVDKISLNQPSQSEAGENDA